MDLDKKLLLYKILAITFAVLFTSTIMALIIFNYKVSSVDNITTNLADKANETRILSSYYDTVFDYNQSNSCTKLESFLNKYVHKIYESGVLLESIYTGRETEGELKSLQRNQIYMSLDFFVRLYNFNKLCPDIKKDYIIYFYNYNCSECSPLATYINKKRIDSDGNLFVINIPRNSDVDIVDQLVAYYDINNLPAVVVNGSTITGTDAFNNIDDYLSRG